MCIVKSLIWTQNVTTCGFNNDNSKNNNNLTKLIWKLSILWNLQVPVWSVKDINTINMMNIAKMSWPSGLHLESSIWALLLPQSSSSSWIGISKNWHRQVARIKKIWASREDRNQCISTNVCMFHKMRKNSMWKVKRRMAGGDASCVSPFIASACQSLALITKTSLARSCEELTLSRPSLNLNSKS